MTNDKICESCGMPMQEAKDFGAGDVNNKYCVHCTDEKGNLKSFEEILAGMKHFAISSLGVHEEEAEKIAKENMSKMPAWKEQLA